MVTQNVKTDHLLQMAKGSKGSKQNDALEQVDFSKSMENAEKTYQKVKDKSGQDDKVQEAFSESNAEQEDFDLKPEKKAAMEMIADLIMMQNQNQAAVIPELEQTANNDQEMLFQIAESLDISTEELESLLKEFELELTDLKEPEHLMKVFMEVKDLKSAGELLTNPELANAFKELNQTVDEFVPTKNAEQNVPDQVLNHSMLQQQQPSGEDAGKNAMEQSDAQVAEQVQTVQIRQVDVMQNQIQELLTDRVGNDTSEKILEQVVQQVKTTMKQDVTSIQMQLYPEHLGKVSIEIVSKNGVMTAHIATENESAKAALESQINILKETFETQGLKVESVEVMVSTKSFEQNQNPEKHAGEEDEKTIKRRRTFLETTEETEETAKEDGLKETLGNTVSYIA